MSTFTLVQPRARRREWELRRGDGRRTDEAVARLRRDELELSGRTLTWKRSRFVDESGVMASWPST
jgi:hypothetical protein